MLTFYIAVAIGVLWSEIRKVLNADSRISGGIILSFVVALLWPIILGIKISDWLQELDEMN